MEGYYKSYLEEVGWEDIDWIYPAQDTCNWRDLVDTVL